MLGKLTIHPLTIMECTLDSPSYMSMQHDEALEYAKKLISRVAEFEGECVLLWHNTSLMPVRGNWQRNLYCECVEFAKDMQ